MTDKQCSTGAVLAAEGVIQKIEDHFSGEDLKVYRERGRFDVEKAFVTELASIIDKYTAPEWIKCADRMPEEGEWVQVYTKGGQLTAMREKGERFFTAEVAEPTPGATDET